MPKERLGGRLTLNLMKVIVGSHHLLPAHRYKPTVILPGIDEKDRQVWTIPESISCGLLR